MAFRCAGQTRGSAGSCGVSACDVRICWAEARDCPDWPPEAVASVNVELWPWSDGFEGMENHSGYPNLTRGMVAAGYSDERITKIMGENHLRMIREVVG